MSKEYRKPIANSTKSRATQKLGEFLLISVGLRAPIHCKVSCVMIVQDDFTRYGCVYFLERE